MAEQPPHITTRVTPGNFGGKRNRQGPCLIIILSKKKKIILKKLTLLGDTNVRVRMEYVISKA